MRCTIKPMSMADYREVFNLWTNTQGVGLDESDTRSAIAAYLKRNPGMSLVARNGKELIGTILCGHDGRRGYLYHLAVLPQYRRASIGTRLVAKCLGKLKRLGIIKCNIYHFADNVDGKRFWLNSGWKNRPDVRLMQKRLVSTRHKRCS